MQWPRWGSRLSFQKFIAALCILVYGVLVDAVDEYICIAESTVIEALLNRFCKTVCES